MTEDILRAIERNVVRAPLMPDVIPVSHGTIESIRWHLNASPKERARKYLADARAARMRGESPQRYFVRLLYAVAARRELMLRPSLPAPGDVLAWRARIRREAILYSRERGRRLSRVLRELDERDAYLAAHGV